MMRAVLALCASAVLGVAIGVGGCDDTYSPGLESGGAKGPEILGAPASGKPVSPSASANTPGTVNPPLIVFPTIPCDEGLACPGTAGCASACDPVGQFVISCSTCVNGAFTDCSERPCP
jgi:hypothetical protein